MKKRIDCITRLRNCRQGVSFDLLQMNGHLIAEQTDTQIHIKHVLVRDIEKYKNVGLDESLHLTDNFKDIIEDDEVEIVVEVMGSADFAKACIEECFRRGKSVVSANKDVIADCGIGLLKLAQENGADFQFEASVAGGIPIIRTHVLFVKCQPD